MEIRTLKQLRESAGVGFNEACRELGIGSAHLFRWEKGQYVPGARYIRSLARLYRVGTDDVLDVLERQRQSDAVSSTDE